MTSSRIEAIREEAAAWLARLRHEDRDAADEAAFKLWLGQSDDHRAAFDAVTATFELAGALRDEPALRPRRTVMDRRLMLTSAGLAAAAIGVGWFVSAPAAYATGIGETRTIALDDGSSIFLDAESDVRVKFDGRQRRVSLVKGRAFFRAAADPVRPFIVSAADQRIVGDAGDAFDVRLKDEAVSVVAVKGAVLMMPEGRPASRTLAAAGQKLVAAPGQTVRRETTDLQTATSWRFGRVVFENETLADALGEMNRYSRRRIEIDDPALRALRISGVYKTGDNEAFARSVALLLDLHVRDEAGALVIERADAA